MKRIYSKKEPLMLLHLIQKKKDVAEGLERLSPPTEYIQVSACQFNKSNHLEPHKHRVFTKITNITQEALIVVRGKLKITLYDIDDKELEKQTLTAGDCCITYVGGHKHEIKQDGTIFYAINTGPFYGDEKDKIKITEVK